MIPCFNHFAIKRLKLEIWGFHTRPTSEMDQQQLKERKSQRQKRSMEQKERKNMAGPSSISGDVVRLVVC